MNASVKAEYYSEDEVQAVKVLGKVAKTLTEVANDGKGGFVLVGITLFFVDLVDFINIATLYAFLDIARPGNLESIFDDFQESLQISPFPMFNFDMPFSEYDELCNSYRPPIY